MILSITYLTLIFEEQELSKIIEVNIRLCKENNKHILIKVKKFLEPQCKKVRNAKYCYSCKIENQNRLLFRKS